MVLVTVLRDHPARIRLPSPLERAITGTSRGVTHASMIQRKSQKLVDEDHDPWEREAAGNGSERDRQSLGELKVSFDHCWDLSRHRRAGGGQRQPWHHHRPRPRRPGIDDPPGWQGRPGGRPAQVLSGWPWSWGAEPAGGSGLCHHRASGPGVDPGAGPGPAHRHRRASGHGHRLGATVQAQPGRRRLATGGGRGAAHRPPLGSAGATGVGGPARPGRPRLGSQH